MAPAWSELRLDDVPDVPDDDVGRLAAALCSLPFIPFETLRAMRKLVAPDVSERVFCDAPLVDGLAADGASLDPVVASALRHRVRSFHALAAGAAEAPRDDDVARLREVLDRYEHRLSPLLAIEERLAWLWLTETDPAAFRSSADGLLRDIILTATREGRRKIFRWASAASRRLPIECFDSELGWILGQLCRVRRIPFPGIDPPTAGFRDRTMLEAIIDHLPDRLIGLHRDGTHLDLGWIDSQRHVGIPVVDTAPTPVTVHHHRPAGQSDGGDGRTEPPETTTIWLPPGGRLQLPVGRAAVVLTDLRGRSYELDAFDGDEAPETVAARRALERATEHLESQEPLLCTVLRRVASSGSVVQLDEPGCSAYLGRTPVFLQPGMRLLVIVTKITLDERRVFVRLSFEPRPIGPRRFPPEHVVRRSRSTVPAPLGAAVPAEIVRLGPANSGRQEVVVLIDHDDELWPATAGGEVSFPEVALSGTRGWHPTVGRRCRVAVLAEHDDAVLLGLDLTNEERTPSVGAWYDDGSVTVGTELDAEVTAVVDYGAFLRLPDGRRGLLHRSNALLLQPFKRDVTHRVGDIVRVRVIDINADQRRISLRQLPTWNLDAVEVGMPVHGRVVRIEAYGLFVRLTGHPGVEGFEALLHRSQVPGFAEGHEFELGTEVEATLISVDTSGDHVRMNLGAPYSVRRWPTDAVD